MRQQRSQFSVRALEVKAGGEVATPKQEHRAVVLLHVVLCCVILHLEFGNLRRLCSLSRPQCLFVLHDAVGTERHRNIRFLALRPHRTRITARVFKHYLPSACPSNDNEQRTRSWQTLTSNYGPCFYATASTSRCFSNFFYSVQLCTQDINNTRFILFSFKFMNTL